MKKIIILIIIAYMFIVNICCGICSTNIKIEKPKLEITPIIVLQPKQYCNDMSAFNELKKKVDHAWETAEFLLSYKGSCYYIMSLFVKLYYGVNIKDCELVEISREKARIGDIIYYTNGGGGLQHWAVFLSQTQALHGNYGGKTIIGDVDLINASTPTIYRLKTE